MNTQIMQNFNAHLLGDGEQTLVIGHGQADISDTNPHHYNSIESCRDDVLEIYEAFGLTNTLFIGQSA